MWIAKTKRKIALSSLWGWTWVDKMGTEDETQMERSGQNLMINSPYFFFLCWSLRFIWIYKTFVFFLDFNKFRTRRLNDRKMFAFYVQVKWQEISYLFLCLSPYFVLSFLLLVGMIYRGINRTKSPKLIQRTGLTQILNWEKVKLIQKNGSFLDRQSSETSLSLFKERNKTKSFISFSSTTQHSLIDWQKDKRFVRVIKDGGPKREIKIVGGVRNVDPF